MFGHKRTIFREVVVLPAIVVTLYFIWGMLSSGDSGGSGGSGGNFYDELARREATEEIMKEMVRVKINEEIRENGYDLEVIGYQNTFYPVVNCEKWLKFSYDDRLCLARIMDKYLNEVFDYEGSYSFHIYTDYNSYGAKSTDQSHHYLNERPLPLEYADTLTPEGNPCTTTLRKL